MSAINLNQVGSRIRKQRMYLGYTRENLSEKLGVTPKFCSDIELGQKGMSLQTLCNISHVLKLSTDYILFGSEEKRELPPLVAMLERCPPEKRPYAEELLKIFLTALD